MDIHLEKKLFKKYPKIFKQYNLPCTQTSMCWGCECGDGWFELIEKLCDSLQWDIDKNNFPQIEFVQVKEKYGGLRIYYSHIESKSCDMINVQRGMIKFAEIMSFNICERCGTNKNVTQTTGWIYTVCSKCLKKHGESNVY